MTASHGQTESEHVELIDDRDLIIEAEQRVLDAAERMGYADAARFAIRLALEEAITNAFKHGHAQLPPTTTVGLSYEISSEKLTVDIEDQGPGFDPDAVADPTLDENLERPFGRGLMLIRAYMTSVEHIGRGNHVRFVFDPNAPVDDD
ncbi:MAG: ATP-binding protein [Planctomycetota bacterium]